MRNWDWMGWRCFVIKQNRQIIKAFLSWIVGNLLGWVFISTLLVVLPVLKTIPGFLGSLLTLLILTLPFGLVQWLVLRRFISLSLIWSVTILVGCLFSFLIFAIIFLIFATIPESLGQIIGIDDEATVTIAGMYAVVGAAIGLSQWFILRRKFTKTVMWIMGSSVGLGLGFGLVLATDLINRSEFVSYTVVVLVYGIATGLILSWLLGYEFRRPTAPPNRPLKQASDSGKI